eukprot:EG_transcript_35704
MCTIYFQFIFFQLKPPNLSTYPMPPTKGKNPRHITSRLFLAFPCQEDCDREGLAHRVKMEMSSSRTLGSYLVHQSPSSFGSDSRRMDGPGFRAVAAAHAEER